MADYTGIHMHVMDSNGKCVTCGKTDKKLRGVPGHGEKEHG